MDQEREAFTRYRDNQEQQWDDLLGGQGFNNMNLLSRNQLCKIKPPVFKGHANEKPMHFLADLEKYLIATNTNEENLVINLQQCLEKKANDWFYTIEHKIRNFDNFKKHFKDRFWSESTKSLLRSKLETGHFEKSKGKTRVEYAENLLAIIKELEIQMDDHEIMIKISRHFDDPLISRTVRLQGIKTEGMLYDLLQDYDNQDAEINQNKFKQFNSKKNDTFKNRYDPKFRDNEKSYDNEKNYQKRFSNQGDFRSRTTSVPRQGGFQDRGQKHDGDDLREKNHDTM